MAKKKEASVHDILIQTQKRMIKAAEAEAAEKAKAKDAQRNSERSSHQPKPKQSHPQPKEERKIYNWNDYPFINRQAGGVVVQIDGLLAPLREKGIYLDSNNVQAKEAQKAIKQIVDQDPEVGWERGVREFAVKVSRHDHRDLPYQFVRPLLECGLKEVEELDVASAQELRDLFKEFGEHKRQSRDKEDHNYRECETCEKGRALPSLYQASDKKNNRVVYFSVGKAPHDSAQRPYVGRIFSVLSEWRDAARERQGEADDFYSFYPVNKNLSLVDVVAGQAHNDEGEWVKCGIPHHDPFKSENNGRKYENSGFFLVKQLAPPQAGLVEIQIAVPGSNLSQMFYVLGWTKNKHTGEHTTFEFILDERMPFNNLGFAGQKKRAEKLRNVLLHALRHAKKRAEAVQETEAVIENA